MITPEFNDSSDESDDALYEENDEDELMEQEVCKGRFTFVIKMLFKKNDITEGSESAREFERILLTNPNSILHWISYIHFIARRSTSRKNYALGKDVAERALKTIIFEFLHTKI